MTPKSKIENPVRFQNVQPLPIDKTLTPALMYVFDQPLTVIEHERREVR